MTLRRKKPIAEQPLDVAALEHELRAKQNQRRRARDAQVAEAESIARVTGKHYRSRPTGGAA